MHFAADWYKRRRAAGLAVLVFPLVITAGVLFTALWVAGAELRQAPQPAVGQQAAPGRQQFLARPAPDQQRTPGRKPAKIKLHRGPKGDYAWDLTGENVEEILRIDRRLHKAFEGQGESDGK